jgi:hypothetical protein
MPVTAKLSKAFYDRLGEAVANELVEWFNQVDAAYRSDLRDINERNFARFDAKLDQRLGTFEVTIERRLAALEVMIERRLTSFEVTMTQRLSGVEVTLERGLRQQLRWMFVVWSALLIPIIGLWFRK